MTPRKTAAPKPAKPWRREADGTYRSSDDRFELQGDGAGRWFVRDLEAADELGLPRTTGPLATLADAKAAADRQREAGIAQSPFAERLSKARTIEGSRAGSAMRPSPPRAPRPSTPPVPPPPTWLDELEDRDPAAARRAREQITALNALGVSDAETLVRRDRLGASPAIAERLLARLIAARLAAALASAPGRPEDKAATAAAVLAAVLEAIADGGPDHGLPGWELVERESGRRISVAPDEVARAGR